MNIYTIYSCWLWYDSYWLWYYEKILSLSVNW